MREIGKVGEMGGKKMTNLFDIYSVPDEERGDDVVN